MAVLLGVIFVGISLVADRLRHRPVDEPAGDASSARSAGGRLRRSVRRSTTCSRPRPRSSYFSPRTPVTTPSRGWPRSSPRTAICPRQFSFRGDRLAYSSGSSSWLVAIAFDRPLPTATRPRSSRSTRSVCSSRSRVARAAWSATGSASGAQAGAGSWASTASDAVLTVTRSSWSSRRGQGRRSSLFVVILIPILVLMMLFIHRQYSASAASWRSPTTRHRAATSRGAGRRPGPGYQPSSRPGGQRRTLDRDRRPGRVHLGRRRSEAAAHPGALGAPATGRSAGHRRVALSRPGRADARVPRRPRPRLAAGQGGADHVRGHPRVRRPQLVGADPLQPVGPALPDARSWAGRTRSSSTSHTVARIPGSSLRVKRGGVGGSADAPH